MVLSRDSWHRTWRWNTSSLSASVPMICLLHIQHINAPLFYCQPHEVPLTISLPFNPQTSWSCHPSAAYGHSPPTSLTMLQYCDNIFWSRLLTQLASTLNWGNWSARLPVTSAVTGWRQLSDSGQMIKPVTYFDAGPELTIEKHRRIRITILQNPKKHNKRLNEKTISVSHQPSNPLNHWCINPLTPSGATWVQL